MSDRYVLPAEPRAAFCGPGALWSRVEAIVVLAVLLLGAGGLTLAWLGSAGEADWRDNASWLTVATASVALGGLGILVWLTVGKARLTTARRAVQGMLARRMLPPDASAELSTHQDTFVTTSGMRRYHRPNCLLMTGKTAVAVNGSRAELTSCEMCSS